MRSLIFQPGYLIYRDLYPGQLYYPSLWHPNGSFLALENYKFVTFTGIFLPLRALGLDVYEKAVYLGAVLAAVLCFYWAAYRLLDHVGGRNLPVSKKHLASALGAITFTLNPAAANIFFDFSLFVGYAFSPLILLLFLEVLSGQRRRGPATLLIGALWWLSAIKAHWIVFGAILLIVPLVTWIIMRGWRDPKPALRNNLISTAGIFGIYLLLSAYWLIPFLLSSRTRFVGSYAPMTYESVSYLSYSPWHQAIRLLGAFQAWPYVRFEPPAGLLSLPWSLASWCIPALAAAALYWRRRHWQVHVLFLFALGGFFLVKGVAPPWGEIYNRLVFGSLTPDSFRWLFRVASKWNVFLSLSLSLLVVLGLAEMARRFDGQDWRIHIKRRRSMAALIVVLTYPLMLVWFAWPSFSGDFYGAIEPALLPESFIQANQWLNQQQGESKVNWMPVTNGREMSWNRRPSGDLYTSLSTLPSIATNWNRHPVLYYSYAYDGVATDRIADLGKLLSIMNTGYIAYHDDIVTTHIHEGVEPVAVLIESGEDSLLDKITEQRDLRPAFQTGDITIFENSHFSDPLYVPGRIYLSTGDLTSLNSLVSLEGFDLTDNGIFFDASRSQGRFPTAVDGLLLNRDGLDHLMFAMLPAERLIAPAAYTNHHAVEQYWSRLDIYQFDWQKLLRDYLIYHWGFGYGRDIAARDNGELPPEMSLRPMIEIETQTTQAGEYYLWARHLRHPLAGDIDLWLDGQPVGTIRGKAELTGFDWDPSDPIHLEAGPHVIGIASYNGLSAINVMALISQSEQEFLLHQAETLASQIPNLYFLEAESDFETGDLAYTDPSPAFSSGLGVELNQGESLNTSVDLAVGGKYRLWVRAALPSATAPLRVTLNSSHPSINLTGGDESLRWHRLDLPEVSAGILQLALDADGPAVIDLVLLETNLNHDKPENLFLNNDPPARIQYERLSPTRYRIQVQSTRPFTLALAETYDPLWVASGPDIQVSSMPLYGVINGFYLERSGSYEIILQYQGQQWARVGWLLTALAGITFIPLLLISHRIRSKPLL